MKLLLLFSLACLAISQVVSMPVEANDFGHEQTPLREPQAPVDDDRKVDKRSLGWSSWGWPSSSIVISSGHGHGWPLRLGSGWSGHGGWSGLSSGWSLGWPVALDTHGWHGGWHSKW